MQRLRWPEAAKQQALHLLAEVGAAEASRITGIPAGTISSWGNRTGTPSAPTQRAEQIVAAQLEWAERRTHVATRLGAVADKAVEVLLSKLDNNDITVAQTLDVLEAAVGKAQLLTGEAQTRTESTVTTKAKLIEEARERAGTLRAVS